MQARDGLAQLPSARPVILRVSRVVVLSSPRVRISPRFTAMYSPGVMVRVWIAGWKAVQPPISSKTAARCRTGLLKKRPMHGFM